jgi:hypothetical protein
VEAGEMNALIYVLLHEATHVVDVVTTAKLTQPFYIVVTKDNAEVARFEPMKNELVRRRVDQLGRFYK